MEQPYSIEVRERSGNTQVVPLRKDTFTLGRDPENDLVISDPSVSRHHAIIYQTGGQLEIADNSSRNGVFINNHRLAKGQRGAISRRVLVTVGTVQLRLLGGPAEIPDTAKRPSSVEYIPHSKTWDPILTLSGEFTRASGDRPATARQINLEKLLRVFLDAPLPEIHERIIESIEEVIPFDRCYLIRLKEGYVDDFEIVARRDRSESSSEVFISKEILRRVVSSQEAVVVAETQPDYDPTKSFILSGARSALCMPLIAKTSVTGALYLDRTGDKERFTGKDLETLGPLTGLVALKLENVQLLSAYLSAELDRKELQIAEQVQREFLPKAPPELNGFSMEGQTRPCGQVGGDYMDFFSYSPDTLTLAVGDLSGKGLSAALYMVGVLSTIRALAKEGHGVDELMVRVEEYARSTFRADHFMTILIGQLNQQTGEFTYANAGHLRPMLVRASGEVEELEGGDPALNISNWETFQRFGCKVQPGELLFLYTDGLIEAESPSGDEFGRERLFAVLAANRNRAPGEIRGAVMQEIDTFVAEDTMKDDMTMIVVRRD